MSQPVTLPTTSWGDPAATRHALLVHGIASNAALMWRIGVALADAGWHATAVDLRGHGYAPRTLDYSMGAYAADLVATRPLAGRAWDAVIGHSLGGAASIVAASSAPAWAKQIVPIDPAVATSAEHAEGLQLYLDGVVNNPPTPAQVQQANPQWHPQDCELASLAEHQAGGWALGQTIQQNQPWDFRADAAALTVPTHIISADPAQPDAVFSGPVADEVLAANPLISLSWVPGTGHCPHRDKPEAFATELFAALDR